MTTDDTVSPPEPYYPLGVTLALQAGLVLPLLWRRRTPSAAFTASVMITLADAGARLIHMADNPDTYSDRDIRDAIGRIAGAERSHPSIAYALQQYQAVLEEDRRIERAKRML